MNTAATSRIGFAGLGNIGFPVARRLAEAGNDIVVYDPHPRPERLELLRAAGARIAVSLADAAADRSVFITLLPSSAIVEQVLSDGSLHDGLANTALLIDMSSGFPPDTRRVAAGLGARGFRFVDAPICNGGVDGADAGTMTLILGGAVDDVEEATRVLQPAASTILRAGGIGAGHTVKLVSNLLANAIPALVSEAFAIGRADGLEAATLRSLLEVCAATNSLDLEAYVPPADTDVDASGTFRTDLAAKDMRYAATLAGEHTVPHLFADAAHEFFVGAAFAGHANVEARLAGWAWLNRP
ncbi:2-hydroxy-3-oxopropionate reductase [Okibacterium endophyticum]